MAIAAAAAIATTASITALAGAAETTTELPAGSVVFVGAGQVATDSENVVLRRDSIRISSTLRGIDLRDRPVLMAFALPDIDMAALEGAAVSVLSYDPANATNFVGFWVRADGADVQLEVEQRALALGVIDVTAALVRHGVPLYPLTNDVPDILTALSPEARGELLAQSLTQLNDGQYEPLWTLKSAFHWRQVMPASRTLQLTFGYQPVAGSGAWTEDTASALTARFCVDNDQAVALTRRATAGATVTAHWVHFQPGASGHLRGPIGEYTVDIEKTNEQTVIATCREGFKISASGTLQFRANNHVVDDDVIVVFID
jgi:Domain of unknown function (DUF4424)